MGEKLSDRVINEFTRPGFALYNAYVRVVLFIFKVTLLTGDDAYRLHQEPEHCEGEITSVGCKTKGTRKLPSAYA